MSTPGFVLRHPRGRRSVCPEGQFYSSRTNIHVTCLVRVDLLRPCDVRHHGVAALAFRAMFASMDLVFGGAKAARQTMSHVPKDDVELQLARIRALRERLLAVHYYEESHWLAAAVSFPHLWQTGR